MQTVQAVIFSRKQFLLAAQARDWLKRHGYGGTIDESDPDAWIFEQAPRRDFRGLTTVSVAGSPGVTLRVAGGESESRKAVARKHPLHPSHIVDYEVRVKGHGDNDYRVIGTTSDLGRGISMAKDYAKAHAEPGVVVMWQVRGAVNGKVYASYLKPAAKKATKKRTAKKAPSKRRKKATKKRTAKKAPSKRRKKATKKRTAKKAPSKRRKKATKKRTTKKAPSKRAAKVRRAHRAERRTDRHFA